MSGENEQIEEEKKADGGKIKIPAHLMAAKQTPVAKPAWMQRLASAKTVGVNRHQEAPAVTVNNDTSNEDNADTPSSNRRRMYKVKNIHTVPPPSTSTDSEIKETPDHAPPPAPELEPEPEPKSESMENVQPTMQHSQLQPEPEPTQSRESEILDKSTSFKEEAQHESQPETVEQVLHSSGSSNQDVFEDKTEDGSGTVEEVISSDEDSSELEVESADSVSSGDAPVDNSPAVAAATTLEPVVTTPQPAVAPDIEHSREEPSSKSNVVTSTPSPTAVASRGPPPSREALSEIPVAATKPAPALAPAPVTPDESPFIVNMTPRRPSATDDDDVLVPPRPIPGAVNVSPTYTLTKADPVTLPKRPSLTAETEEPPSLQRANPSKPQGATVDQGIRSTAANGRRDNYDHDDDDDDDDSGDWMFPQRHEDDSSWVNPSHPIQPERKQHLTEELKKKSVDLFPENGQINQRIVHLKSIEEESNLKDFDYDPKVGFIVDPHLRGGDGQTISETSFSEISKMDLSAKIMETAVPKKDLDVWAMPSQEGTYRALGKLDTHKDGKDYRFSYIAQPHTHSTSSYADVVRERYFPKEDNDYWAAPAREAPPELPIHISREGTIQSGPVDENESWLPPEDDPNQPPIDKAKIYAPTLAEEKYSEARSVVSEGSDWIGKGVVTARVDFAGTVTEDNMDSFEWNPAKEPSLAPGVNHNDNESDDSEVDESESLDEELDARAMHATPRPPSPPAVLQRKRASESAPPSDAAPPATSESVFDYSSSGRLKFDLTPQMIMIEGNADKGNAKSGGNYDQVQLRNRCYLFVCLFLIVLLGGIACIVIFVVDPFNKNDDTSTDSVPTMEPTSMGEDDGPTKAPSPTATFFPGPAQNPSTPTPPSSIEEEVLLEFLSEISSDNGEALKDSTSPQYAAMQWLLSSANIGVYTDETLIQRYALATFYYATGGEQWVDSTNWLTDVSECEWYSSSDLGSICDMDENLLELNLMGNSLSGSLPPELNLLSNSLTTLHLGDNKIGDEIPTELSDLWHLETLQLSQNQFRGTIPTMIGTMGNLKTLFLYQNSLRSSIPTQLGQLTTLKELDLGANRLTGGIPTEVGALTGLISLSLYGNDLTGSIPSQLSRLTNLQVLYLDSNGLGPTLPASICSNLNLDEFWSDCDEIGGCECCTQCCQDGVSCA